VKIPSLGFSLAGTLSKPQGLTAMRLPAVVLVGGAGPIDRDGIVAGVPVIGELATQLADAGFITLRYDKRGVGQSGGRIESADITDAADDLQSAVKLLADRRDVDPRRISVIGHSEGGAVAMLAAARERRIAAVGLIATAGGTGAELVLEQQQRALSRLNLTDAEKQARVELQKRINDAVVTGRGWEALPPETRRAVDNPEYQSILAHDPAKVVPRMPQPILIVAGELDRQVAPGNADRLDALARARKNRAVHTVKVPGVNHLLVPAVTGEVAEYAALRDRRVSPAVISAIAGWLRTTLTGR
jgi:pimeloyl-ACP methyl ester carboxylesterase